MNNRVKKILIIDNYDSFTYNLVQIIDEFPNSEFKVVKNNQVDMNEIEYFDKIIFSPGAGIPSEFPVMSNVLKKYQKNKSILGVCLGHQAIAEFYGARLINLSTVYHGIKQTVNITDSTDYLFDNIPFTIDVGLYHSWAVDNKAFPDILKSTAVSTDGIIMAISHKQFDIKGIQFHPESFMTEMGKKILNNWLKQ